MEHKETKLKVPEGFRNLLECLTCEILRAQPSNIPRFAADYLKGRLVSRQEKGYDECLLGSQIDGFYKFEPFLGNEDLPPTLETSNVPSNQKQHHGINYNDDSDLAASKIQAGYRGYTCRKDIKQKHEAATKIQAKFRGYQVRAGNISRSEEARNDKTASRFQSKDDAAVAIQSGYRGYQDRKKIARQSEAATTIQAGYRGYKVRKVRRGQSEAAIKIQSGYRGYRVREICRNQSEAALKIQTNYRGYRVRKVQSDRSEAASRIQANYRGYRVRKQLKEKLTNPIIPKRDALLEVGQHYDTRYSFSLPAEDVQFDVNFDSDSDVDIDKVVDQMEAKNKMKDENSTVNNANQS